MASHLPIVLVFTLLGLSGRGIILRLVLIHWDEDIDVTAATSETNSCFIRQQLVKMIMEQFWQLKPFWMINSYIFMGIDFISFIRIEPNPLDYDVKWVSLTRGQYLKFKFKVSNCLGKIDNLNSMTPLPGPEI